MTVSVRSVSLAEIRKARLRLAGKAMRTPLIRLETNSGPEIWLKLENLQPTNSYKVRGALNAVAMLNDEERALGVWTISAGNAGQGIAYAARHAGIHCSIVAIETAPIAKIQRMRALGAEVVLVPYDTAWKALSDREFPGMTGRLVHPFDDTDFITGHGTLGLEILEDLPQVQTIAAAIGGGGLVCGIASAVKAMNPAVRIVAAEPETAYPFARSLAENRPVRFEGWTASFIDGAGGKSMLPSMWQRLNGLVDQAVVVTLDETKHALQIMAAKSRIIAEGAGALPLAAALAHDIGHGPIVAVVSGGNIDLDVFCTIIDANH